MDEINFIDTQNRPRQENFWSLIEILKTAFRKKNKQKRYLNKAVETTKGKTDLTS